MSENSSELDMFETGRRSPGGDEIERIRAETARINAEAEKIKAENERLAAQNAAARSKSLEEEELTKWEYTRADVQNIEKLNALGEQGWKLVGVSSDTIGRASEGVLMRKKQTQQNQSYNGYSR
ncbi:MAG: hypothetical protein K6A42_03970 [Treponema sp.]|nr:hypothetical protein [Treponema sp.]